MLIGISDISACPTTFILTELKLVGAMNSIVTYFSIQQSNDFLRFLDASYSLDMVWYLSSYAAYEDHRKGQDEKTK